MKEPLTHRIYVLVDPGTQEIRYVGRTIKKLEDRLKQHTSYRKNLGKRRWLDDLEARGLQPQLRVIDEVTGNYDDAKDVEKQWVTKLLAQGEPLVNVQYAGPNGSWKLLPEQIDRLRMRRKKLAEERRKK